jgi:hypothetical protein
MQRFSILISEPKQSLHSPRRDILWKHCLLSFYQRNEQILIDPRRYDGQIVLPILSHSAGPCLAELCEPTNSNRNAAYSQQVALRFFSGNSRNSGI